VELTRSLSPEPLSPVNDPETPRIHLEALLDNIRSAWNVGAIFRTADCLGVDKLYLCGITPTPENDSVQKTSLGAESSVKWEYARNALLVAERLKAEGARLWALEQDERAVPLNAELRMITDEKKPLVLIIGNEVTGVDPALLDLCDKIVYIPMRGSKRSLNVEVAFGVAVSALVNERGR
jgi:tRNA G18 (ribose-2'-O)-methylase SpoU